MKYNKNYDAAFIDMFMLFLQQDSGYNKNYKL